MDTIAKKGFILTFLIFRGLKHVLYGGGGRGGGGGGGGGRGGGGGGGGVGEVWTLEKKSDIKV